MFLMARKKAEPGTVSAVGLNLRRIREEKDLTAEKLEELSGVSHVTISRTETGHTEPRGPTVKKLARAMGVSAEELYKAEGSNIEQSATGGSLPPGLDEFLRVRGLDVTRREEQELKQMRIVLTRPVTPGLEFWDKILAALRTLNREQPDPA